MKAWMTAKAAGHCSSDRSHTWKEGERVFLVQGSSWRKLFCKACGEKWPESPVDDGREPVTQVPLHIKPLQALAERFDVRMKQAGNDE